MANDLEKIHTRLLTARVLTEVASTINKSMNAFSGWLMAGVGAAFSLLIANFDKVVDFVALLSIKRSLFLLLLSLFFGIIARFLAALVSASVQAGNIGSSLTEVMQAKGQVVDLPTFLIEFNRGVPPWGRWLNRRMMKKTMEGDLAAASRFLARISQVQTVFVFIQACLVLAAGSMILLGVDLLATAIK
jgi:hypothetical protein